VSRDLRIWTFEFRFLSSALFPVYVFRTAIEPSFLVVLATENVLANTLENK